jgi:hypothetical protein
MTFEPTRFFWTKGGAAQFYRDKIRYEGALERMGLYRWDGERWIKQRQAAVDIGMNSVWVDEY